MRVELLIIIVLFVNACISKPEKISSADTERVQKDSITTDSIKSAQSWQIVLKNIDEPDFKEVNYEAYRFMHSDLEGNTYYIFTLRVYRSARRQYISPDFSKLFTKIVKIYKKGRNDKFAYGRKIVSITKDTVIASSEQKLADKKNEELHELLLGSYFWNIQDYPCGFNGLVFREDIGYTLESKSFVCDSLRYHVVNFRDLYPGNFSELWQYLAKVSILTKDDKELHRNLNIR
jgi:hypothetical protein